MASPVGITNAKYAKCPRCLRMDLSAWDPKYYRPSFWMELRVWLGAHRWRCDPCRHNFVSFRPRKLRYVRPGDRPASEPNTPTADYHELLGG